MPTSEILQHLYSLDASSPDFMRYLYCLFQTDEEEKYLSSLQGSQLIRLVDFLDGALQVAPATDDVSRRCLHKLRDLCGNKSVLPSSYTISEGITGVSANPVAGGGCSEVREGTYKGKKICVKQITVYQKDHEKFEGAFYKEAIIWKRLTHPNVVPFIGVAQNSLRFVSEWMPNGTITEYVVKNPTVNRVDLLLDVAEGLYYLHSNHTIHGDLKGPNVLIDGSGHARLADFGFASVVRRLHSVSVTKVQGLTPVWTAPELLTGDDRGTREADIFSLGMVVAEIFTGEPPFGKSAGRFAFSKIIAGERPDRPQDPSLTEPLWRMTVNCWHQDPAHRPAVVNVVEFLRECYRHRIVNSHSPRTTPPWQVGRQVDARTFDYGSMPLGFCDAYRRINEVAEEVENDKEGPLGQRATELLRLCHDWHAVPKLYELGVIVKQGQGPQQTSRMTEIQKGVYQGKLVALKTLRLSQNCPDLPAAKQRFCAGAVLMKQIEHDNILPFYGVSATITDFRLVFPWYKNGNIKGYLERNPAINRFCLLVDAVKGLCFLHENGVVHGALRPTHILIDDNENARLTIAAHDISSVRCAQSLAIEDIKDHSYTAPETRAHPERFIDDTSSGTKESDVYELAVVVYEVLTGIEPHYEYRGPDYESSIKLGETPVLPRGLITSLVRDLLERCWHGIPGKRPQTAQVCNAMLNANFSREHVNTPWRPATGELPRKFKVYIYDIKFLTKPRGSWRFNVNLQHGGTKHSTQEYYLTDSDEYTLMYFDGWAVQTEGNHPRLRLELVMQRRTGSLARLPTRAAGSFSLQNSLNKQIIVELRESDKGFAHLKAVLTEV